MSTKTRRRLMWCAVLAVLILPPEFVALEVLAESNKPLPEVWVSRMSPDDLSDAAANITAYPVEYRRALLSKLSPIQQAEVWRRTAVNFRTAHQNVSPAAVGLLKTVEDLATVSTFVGATKETKERLNRVATELRTVLGDQAYRELFLQAGPATLAPGQARALPFRVRLASALRSRVLKAAESPNCNCYIYGTDCSDNGTWYCTQTVTCDFWWIGCGIWYQSPCDGYCIPVPVAKP